MNAGVYRITMYTKKHNSKISDIFFSANMFGRKKRQAQIISDPLHEVQCDVMSKNSTVCAEYRTRCQSCPQTSNITDGDVIQQGKHSLVQ